MDRKFIEQAKVIRREYIKVVKNIAKSEAELEIFRDQLKNIESELNDKMDEDLIRSKMTEIEKNLKSIENIIVPFDKKVKKLEKDADKLFENIKSRYPKMTAEEIQNEMIPYLAEIKF